jgi:translation elongation factor EF-G
VSDLIPSARPAIFPVGDSAETLSKELGTPAVTLEDADVFLITVSAVTGISPDGVELWNQARELYVPSIVVVNDLVGSETDFDDMVPIIGRLLEPVVNPFLILHDDKGSPTALIDLDSLHVIDYSNGIREVRNSDPEHKLLVFEFRKEYLEALTAAGEGAFEAALLYPAIPFVETLGLGKAEITGYLERLPVRG